MSFVHPTVAPLACIVPLHICSTVTPLALSPTQCHTSPTIAPLGSIAPLTVTQLACILPLQTSITLTPLACIVPCCARARGRVLTLISLSREKLGER